MFFLGIYPVKCEKYRRPLKIPPRGGINSLLDCKIGVNINGNSNIFL